MNRLHIAQVAHEVHRAYCAALGDTLAFPSWDEANESLRASVAAGVDMVLATPDATPEQRHEAWMAAKAADGWAYGETRDADAKTHPCMLPYDELPESQRVKDYLFAGVVRVLRALPQPASDSGAAASSTQTAAVLARTQVEYIGRRFFTDRLYGTGLSFDVGQKRSLPADVARNFLRHQDLFRESAGTVSTAAEPGETGGGNASATEAADDTAAKLAEADKGRQAQAAEAGRVQDMKDTLATMDKDAIKSFAQTNYRVSLPKNLSVENMRIKAAELIDQFGVV